MSDPTIPIWSAPPTPFTADGKLDEPSIVRIIEHHVELGAGGLLIGGSTGEGPYMTATQRAELARLAVKAAAGRLHIALQVSDMSAARALENLDAMRDVAFDSIVIAQPFLAVTGPELFVRGYFDTLLEAADRPVGLYARPIPAALGLKPEWWGEWALHDRVTYAKDSSGNAVCGDALLAARDKKPGLMVLQGDEFAAVQALAKGYDGSLLGTGTLNLRLIRLALDAQRAGDTEAARQWQERSNQFLFELFRPDISCWLGGFKEAAKQIGLFSTTQAHLTYEVTAEDRQRIRVALDREREYWQTSQTS